MRSNLNTRLHRLEEQSPTRSWPHTEGLCALLEHARRHWPQPWALPPLDEDAPLSGMAMLLQEARQHHNDCLQCELSWVGEASSYVSAEEASCVLAGWLRLGACDVRPSSGRDRGPPDQVVVSQWHGALGRI